MKNIKNTLRAATMLAVIAFGTTFANAGIIIGGLQSDPVDPCTENTGIIIGGLTGIIIGGFTGIIIGGARGSDGSTDPCGIIIGG
jgi:hypothetical protein